MDATSTIELVTDYTAAAGNALNGTLPIVLGVIASLFVLGWVIRFFKKHSSR